MRSPGLWSRALAVGLAAVLGLALMGAPAQAQEAGAGGEKKVTLNLRDIPLRSAIDLLFQGSGLQYAVEQQVPNVPVTLNVKDLSVDAALRLLIRLSGVQNLTFAKTGMVYEVKIRQPPMSTGAILEEFPPEESAEIEDTQWEKIPVQFNNVAVFALAFGGAMLPTEDQVVSTGLGGGGGFGGLGGGGFGGLGGGGFGGGRGGFGFGFGF